MRQFQPGQPILHAYILAAADAALRETEVTALAAAMLCTAPGERPCGQCRDCRKVFRGVHPDVICVDPASGSKRPVFKVDQIRDVSADAYVMPSEAQRKVYVLRQADTMNPAAQNALLKLLEEPPRSASFILAAERVESLLPTVRSRCEIIRCNSEAEALPETAVQEAETYLALFARGCFAGAGSMSATIPRRSNRFSRPFSAVSRRIFPAISRSTAFPPRMRTLRFSALSAASNISVPMSARATFSASSR